MQIKLKELVTGKQMKRFFIKILPYTILLISISSILQWCSLPIGNTFLWWTLQSIILYIFIKLKPKDYNIFPIKLFLFYLIISALYGAIFMTENYWDWKLLVNNLMVFSLPLAGFVFFQPKLLNRLLRRWFKYSWIILIILMPFLGSDAYGRFLVPFTFIALYFPLASKKYKILTLFAFFITITIGNDSRSDMLKFTICLLLGISLWLGFIWKKRKIIITMSLFLLATPIILFILGVTNTFNIFQIEEELNIKNKYIIENKDGERHSALVDTRTFLYAEQIQSAIKNNYVLFGRSIARGYDSVSFGDWADKAMGIKRGERQRCETSILNIFNYFGIIGIILYLVIFIYASFLAIYKSRNLFISVIGIYVAFRWLFAWIEDFSRFDLNYLFLWILIGICYSPIFRNMSNKEFILWFKNVTK